MSDRLKRVDQIIERVDKIIQHVDSKLGSEMFEQSNQID